MDRNDQGAVRRDPLEVTVSAARDLGAARAAVRSWLRGSIPGENVDEILLASGEAVANVLEHGRTPISLSLSWTDDTLDLTVRDAGGWRVSANAIHPKPPQRGPGIPIMTALTDSLTFETTDGTTVKLSRRFGP